MLSRARSDNSALADEILDVSLAQSLGALRPPAAARQSPKRKANG